MLRFALKIYQGTNSLIILDDCACSSDVKKRVSELVKLGFGAKDSNTTIDVIATTYYMGMIKTDKKCLGQI